MKCLFDVVVHKRLKSTANDFLRSLFDDSPNEQPRLFQAEVAWCIVPLGPLLDYPYMFFALFCCCRLSWYILFFCYRCYLTNHPASSGPKECFIPLWLDMIWAYLGQTQPQPKEHVCGIARPFLSQAPGQVFIWVAASLSMSNRGWVCLDIRSSAMSRACLNGHTMPGARNLRRPTGDLRRPTGRFRVTLNREVVHWLYRHCHEGIYRIIIYMSIRQNYWNTKVVKSCLELCLPSRNLHNR